MGTLPPRYRGMWRIFAGEMNLTHLPLLRAYPESMTGATAR